LIVAFVCIGNSCRSQMAEGFAHALGEGKLEAYSAGTDPAGKVNENAILVMAEKGVDITGQSSKTMEALPGKIDLLVTMGCGVECPFMPALAREDWGLDDPVGKPLEEFRRVRDIIEEKVRQLLARQ